MIKIRSTWFQFEFRVAEFISISKRDSSILLEKLNTRRQQYTAIATKKYTNCGYEYSQNRSKQSILKFLFFKIKI